jgi:Reverse transcriptase (RNA-dependent DNA polymerase).
LTGRTNVSPDPPAEEYYNFDDNIAEQDEDADYVPPSPQEYDEDHITLRTSSRIRRPVDWYGNEQARDAQKKSSRSKTKGGDPPNIYAMAVDRLRTYKVKVPRTYKQATKSKQKRQWHDAMEAQIQKLEDKEAWSLVPYPKDPSIKILPGKWVYDLKPDADGYVQGFRARWVVCGNYQQTGVDYEQRYSPVVCETAVKMFLTLVAVRDLHWIQCDIVTAYLNAALKDQQVYMQQPIGFVKGKHQVCLLQQALYGLR